MNKKLLEDYIDACELIRETEEDIRRLDRKKRTIVQDNVKGSNPEFPFEEKHFHVAGTVFAVEDDSKLRYEKKVLEERKANAEKIKLQVDAFINTVPVRIQRIIRMRYFEEKSWETIAGQLGRKATADGVRKEFERFISYPVGDFRYLE